MWNMPTPNIDSVIQVASTMLGVDYFEKGLGVEDLGIAGMQPQEVKALIT
jgi:hypothetical protein